MPRSNSSPPPAPRRLRRASALCLALACLLCAAGALADGTADEAELHFRIGSDAAARRDWLSALEHMLASNRLAPNRNVMFNVAFAYENLGEPANAHRYYVDALQGETDAATRARVEEAIARVARSVAVLDIETSPPGATLYVDREDLGSRGSSPRPLALPPGRYRVIARLDGYRPATSEPVEVAVGERAAVSLELTRIVGSVELALAGVDSAEVRVDAEDAPVACEAPCRLELSPGPHVLYAERAGFRTWVRTLQVVADGTSHATAELAPLTGAIVIAADEPGALVSVDERPVGFAPTVARDVPAGHRRVRAALSGHVPVELEVDVTPGEESDLGTVALEPMREVTAVSRFDEKQDDAPSSVSVVEGAELRAFGYPTIAEALRGVRGVYLNNDRAYASIGVRGIGEPNDYGNRLLVLSDGQPLNDNLLNSSYVGSDGRADLHDIDRIEVVRGPGSLLYGAGAFSGVVNLVTRPRDEPSQAHVSLGTYDDSVLRARVGGHYGFAEDGGFWASISGAHSPGHEIVVPLAGDDGHDATAHGVDRFHSIGTAGRVFYGPVTAQWFFHRRDQSIPVGAYATTFDDASTRFVDSRFMTEVRYEPRIGDEFQLLARLHANRYTFSGDYAFGDERNVEDYAGTWVGGELRGVYEPAKGVRLTLGGEVQIHPEASLEGRAITASGESTYLDTAAPYRFGAAYAVAELAPAPWLRLSGGTRLDVYSTFGAIFVPRAAAIFKPTDGGTLKFMGGRAFRAPSIYEQVYNDGGISAVPSTDPERGLALGPESVYSGEIEYAQRFLEDWVVLGAMHGSYLAGLISSEPDTPGSSVVRYQNSDSPALVLGGDVELRHEWRRGYMLTASYGYVRARYLASDLEDPTLVNVPEHLASVRGVVPLLAEMVSLGLRATVEAPRRISLDRDDRTSPDLVVDATLSGKIRPIGLGYTVGVYNLGDRKYVVPVEDTFRSPTMPQNGRTFLLDLEAAYP